MQSWCRTWPPNGSSRIRAKQKLLRKHKGGCKSSWVTKDGKVNASIVGCVVQPIPLQKGLERFRTKCLRGTSLLVAKRRVELGDSLLVSQPIRLSSTLLWSTRVFVFFSFRNKSLPRSVIMVGNECIMIGPPIIRTILVRSIQISHTDGSCSRIMILSMRRADA